MEKMKILAIDDNVVNLATIEQELRDVYDVIPVNSGRRALKFIYQEKVDLILLDIQMPVMDGIETLKQIREQENGTTVPVIMLTANHNKATVIEGTKLGIMDYIVKPFDGSDLRKRIERALKRRGALPMDASELYQRIEEIDNCLHNKNHNLAAGKIDEILSYPLEDSVLKRLQTARQKMRSGEFDAAERIVDRILQVLGKKEVKIEDAGLKAISLGELNAKLLFILDDLEHFRVENAEERVDDLMRYEIPLKIRDKCLNAQKCIKEYDDAEAERLVRAALKEL